MIKLTLFILLGFLSINLVSQNKQNNDLYIFDSQSIIKSDEIGTLHYYMLFKSKDPRFINDAYTFLIPNKSGFDEYKQLKDLKQEIKIDTVEYSTKQHLETMDRWLLHEFFSLKKSIFLIEEETNERNGKTEFYAYKIRYLGTRKNLEFIQF